MKTAISLDDTLLREADETARQMGLSRSALFALALAEFLERRRQEQMLLQLNVLARLWSDVRFGAR
jgi:metal-responsive CopG/Arc/MetJ family transcriptional regulator